MADANAFYSPEVEGLVFGYFDGTSGEKVFTCLSHPQVWAAMALGGVKGWLAGRIRLFRSLKANEKLDAFIRAHPEYQ